MKRRENIPGKYYINKFLDFKQPNKNVTEVPKTR